MQPQPLNEAFDILTPLLRDRSPQSCETLMNPHASTVQCIAQACKVSFTPWPLYHAPCLSLSEFVDVHIVAHQMNSIFTEKASHSAVVPGICVEDGLASLNGPSRKGRILEGRIEYCTLYQYNNIVLF